LLNFLGGVNRGLTVCQVLAPKISRAKIALEATKNDLQLFHVHSSFQFSFMLKKPPYTLAGFDLSTHT
jgi:hypothetical protein